MKKTKVPECSHGLRQVLVWAAEHLHLVRVRVRVIGLGLGLGLGLRVRVEG